MIKREASEKRRVAITKGMSFPEKKLFQYILNDKNMLHLNNDTIQKRYIQAKTSHMTKYKS